MSIDTHGKIKGKISHDDILDYIRKNIDKDAKGSISTNSYGKISEFDYGVKEIYTDDDIHALVSGFIDFTSRNGNKRNLFYMYQNINTYENLETYKRYGLEDMVKAETTYLSLGCNDEAVQIISELVAAFGGGWIDENDCDGYEYYPIELDEDGNIIPVCFTDDESKASFFDGTVIVTTDDGAYFCEK